MSDESTVISFFERWRTAIVVSIVVVVGQVVQLILIGEALQSRPRPDGAALRGAEAVLGTGANVDGRAGVNLGEAPAPPSGPNPLLFDAEYQQAVREAARAAGLDPSALPPLDSFFMLLRDSGRGPELSGLGKDYEQRDEESDAAWARRLACAYVTRIGKGEVPMPTIPGKGAAAQGAAQALPAWSSKPGTADVEAMDGKLAARVTDLATRAGKDPATLLPESTLRDKAIQSNSLESPDTIALMNAYQEIFASLGASATP